MFAVGCSQLYLSPTRHGRFGSAHQHEVIRSVSVLCSHYRSVASGLQLTRGARPRIDLQLEFSIDFNGKQGGTGFLAQGGQPDSDILSDSTV